MSRLITFGCSYTFGHGLADCTNYKDPSKLGWASVLSNKMNLPLVNISAPGASNLEILYNILNFKFEQDDVVVIMWSLSLRDLKFKKNLFGSKQYTPYKVMINKPWYAKQWIPEGDIKDYVIKSWIYIQHADLYLSNKNIKFLHYPSHPGELYQHKPDFINISNMSTDGIVQIDLADDGAHPGIESNKSMAENIYNTLCLK